MKTYQIPTILLCMLLLTCSTQASAQIDGLLKGLLNKIFSDEQEAAPIETIKSMGQMEFRDHMGMRWSNRSVQPS